MEFFQAGLPIFLGSLLQGCAGFGFSLLAVPLLLLSFPGAVVTPLLVLLSLAMNLAVWCDCRCRFSGRTLAGLLLGGVAGLLPGMWALAVLPVRGFRFAAGLIVAASALALLSGFRRPLTPRGSCLFSVGLASGFLNGSLSMSGPPVILFLANQVAKLISPDGTLLDDVNRLDRLDPSYREIFSQAEAREILLCPGLIDDILANFRVVQASLN